MNDMPLVTVFIPVYNCEKYIQESLESILNQTYKNIEVLIVDDGSSDKSLDYAKKYNDSRIKIIENKINKGIPYTRNIGLKNSKGKYMAIMDADDIASLDRIEKQVIFLEKNKHIDVLGSYYEEFSGKNKVLRKGPIDSQEIKSGLIFHSQIGNPTAMIRLDKVKNHNIKYNEKYFVSQDYDFWIQISKIGEFAILPEVLLRYRTGHSNITKKSKEDKILKRKHVIDSIHNDILSFYNFNLTEVEMCLFNKFFNDIGKINLTENEVNLLKKVIKKLIDINENNQIFNSNIFKKSLNRALLGGIYKLDMSLKVKINLYDALISNERYKNRIANKTKIIIKQICHS